MEAYCFQAYADALEVIPTTLAATTLGDLRPGDRVNLEVDVVAKYVERLLAARGQANPPDGGHDEEAVERS